MAKLKPPDRTKPRYDYIDLHAHYQVVGSAGLSDLELLQMIACLDPDYALRDENGVPFTDRQALLAFITDRQRILASQHINPIYRNKLDCMLELFTRLMQTRVVAAKLDAPPTQADLVKFLQTKYAGLGQEVMGAVYADTVGRVISVEELFRGTVAECPVSICPILRRALQLNSPQFAIYHTHPGGLEQPTPEDIEFTSAMRAAAHVLELELIDHIIITDAGHLSMREQGLLARVEAA